MEENFNKGNLKNNRTFENQTQRTLNTVVSDDENPNPNSREQRNVRMRLFENNNQNEERLDKDYQVYANKVKQQRNVKYDAENVVGNIIQLEKELIKYIERYKFLSSRLAVFFFLKDFVFNL